MEISIETLLADLSKRGISLRIDDQRLRYSAPAGAVTADVLALLKSHRAALISFLSDRPALAPTSFEQRRFWRLQQLNPNESFYNSPYSFCLSGPLDIDLLQESFNAIVRRHESLRTTLQEIDGSLMQVIAQSGTINVTFFDESREDDIPAFLRREYQRPFDLAREPGMRVLLIRTGENEHILQICMHNTLYDRNSLLVLLKELSAHYTSLRSHEPIALPEPAQYSEYVRWQASLMSNGVEGRLAYWRNWFAPGDVPRFTWTPVEPPPDSPSFRAHLTWQRWSAQQTSILKAFSHKNGATPYIVLVSALALTLRQYTGTSDLTIGTTYSNRHDKKFESLIGATIDVPALRIEMTDNPTLSTLISRVGTVVAEALAFQDVPAECVLPRQPGALFRAVFSFFPEPHDGGCLKLPGIAARFLKDVINDVSRPDLYLLMWQDSAPNDESLTAAWLHKRDVFSALTAESMSRQFMDLLASSVS